MTVRELAWRLCLSSHHGLTMAGTELPCPYHLKRAEDALRISAPVPAHVTREDV